MPALTIQPCPDNVMRHKVRLGRRCCQPQLPKLSCSAPFLVSSVQLGVQAGGTRPHPDSALRQELRAAATSCSAQQHPAKLQETA